MNKLKLLYDVVMTMKDKETLKGTLKVEARKDKAGIFSANNEFEKANGRMKAKICTEADCEGNRVKHESVTEFNSADGGDMHCCFMKHMHGHHGHGHHDHGNFHSHFGKAGGGLKAKLTGFAMLLGIFNSLKVDEQQDKSAVISLDFNEIPADLKKAIHEMHPKGECGDQGHHKFMKEFHDMDSIGAVVKIWVNKNNEVEKVLLTAAGKKKDENNAEHEMDINAELCLAW